MPPTQDQPQTVNNVWGSKTNITAQWVTLPSGQTCQVRRLGVEELIAAGVMPEVDALTPLIESGPVARGKGMKAHQKKAKDVAADEDARLTHAILNNPTALYAMVTLADKICPFTVIDPVVRLHYVKEDGVQRMLEPDEREDGIIYTDQIDFMDKVALIELGIGDLTALASFRGAADLALGSVEPKSDV